MSARRPGRAEPYTLRGISRLRCVRCPKRAAFQWQCCADGNVWRPLCPECDVLVNAIVLEFMRDPDAGRKAATYAQSKGVNLDQAVKRANQ